MFESRIAELNRFNEQNPVSYDKRTYTVDEIQDILGISRPTAYNLVKQCVFHSVRVGGHIRISKKSFDDWLDHADELFVKDADLQIDILNFFSAFSYNEAIARKTL